MVDCINNLNASDPNKLVFSTKNTDKQDWLTAAAQWRLPYWDWAASASANVPGIFRENTISIRVPKDDGGHVSSLSVSNNPLYRYSLSNSTQDTTLLFGTLPKPYTIPVSGISTCNHFCRMSN